MTAIIYGAPIILFSPSTGERYSATKGDYFLTSEKKIFKDKEGNNLWMAQTEYNDFGNLEVKKVLKRRVTVADLPEEDRTRREIPE